MGRKWQNIKMSKGKLDAQRSSAFTQVGRAITIAAREKGGDPEMNHLLKAAIEKAKAVNMPKDNIERAIKKGTGELESDVIEEIVYEGYGPGGSAILVESATDNRNRTAADIKHIFSKHGGNLGGAGSVGWMFERKGVIRINLDALRSKVVDEVEMEAIEAGAEDVKREEEGITVHTKMEDLQSVEEKLATAGYAGDSGLEYVPKDPVAFDAEAHKALEGLLDALEENQDVQETFTNVAL